MSAEFVSRAELTAHLDPIRSDISEIKDDVKSLLRAQARQEEVISVTRDRGARRIAWGSLVTAGIGGLWWVQDAIAKLAHHG